MKTHWSATILIILLLVACQPAQPPPAPTEAVRIAVPTLAPTPFDPGVIALRTPPDLDQTPLLAAYLERVEAALQQPVPVLTLEPDTLDDNQLQAQEIALNDVQFVQYTRDATTGAPLRNEVFGIYPLRDSDITEYTAACTQATCYRVEMYNYAMNNYLAAVVNLDTGIVIDRIGIANSQPDLPQYLVDIAVEIATQSPEVIDALGDTPDASEAVMENTKTALNNTLCERSRHLCVAPTFVIGNYALWTIVDLTDAALVGVRWTAVGESGPSVTEKSLMNEAMMRLYCERNTPLQMGDWSLNYILTSSDGLRISEVTYQGQPVLESVKLVDWHVSYSETQGFGYSDAVGCPVFSQAAVVAVEPPTVEDIVQEDAVIGFALEQHFWSELWPRPCNYRYVQRYEFYNDGSFRPVVISLGRGCGDDGTYRPVTRIAFAQPATFSEWNGSIWQPWTAEGWQLASEGTSYENGAQFRVVAADGSGYDIIPSVGQFEDGGRGDDPYVYVTLNVPGRDEGASDLPTIGPCCNEGYEQGPEKFIEPDPEPLTADSMLVLWYVAQLKNDATPGQQYCWAESVLVDGVYSAETYPCPSGPRLSPLPVSDAATP